MYPRGKTTIFQRAIPTAIQSHDSSANFKQDLKTVDPIKVARNVTALNAKLDAEWAGGQQGVRCTKSHI